MEEWTKHERLLQLPTTEKILAFNVTTFRFGLAPLPSNLIAINTTLDELTDDNFDDIWPPYTFDVTPGSSNYVKRDQLCRDPSCAILVENAFSTTAGPTNADLVGLVHGTVFLVSFVLSLVVMGCWGCFVPSSVKNRDKNAQFDLDQAVREHMNPPRPSRRQRYSEAMQLEQLPPGYVKPPQAGPPSTFTGYDVSGEMEVNRCTALLRELYTLDVRIHHTRNSREQDAVSRRRDMMASANRIFDELRSITQQWTTRPANHWRPSERELVDRIYQEVHARPSPRYNIS